METSPTPDAAVRTARVSDAEAMAAVQAQAWSADLGKVLPAAARVTDAVDAGAFARTWAASLERPPTPRHRALVATEGDALVGLTAIGPTEDGSGELLVLTVLPEARRRGHGSRLLNAAVDTLRANGFGELCCWVPLADETLQGFLRAAGMGPDGAYRDRVIDEASTVREVRLLASLDT